MFTSDAPHTVRDVMTTTVVAVSRDATYKDVIEAMHRWNVGALPVLCGDNRVVGMVSDSDLLPKQELRDSDPSRLERLLRANELGKASAVKVGDLMTAPAVCVRPETVLAEAARLMGTKRVKRLPVVDGDDRLIGVVSPCDVLKGFLRSDEAIRNEVHHEVVSALFPDEPSLQVSVVRGVVTMEGRLRDTSLVPTALRLVHAIEGVVDVRFELTASAEEFTAPAEQLTA
ncbi:MULTISPECIES: CBS domain-containing protein [unclassified Streptomyces]|uniref:CBS domain-containing protein n=1 Tax=unclassified Streptomyces TaxID=2593676 RepID=UPI001F03F86D|nr:MULTISPECIES: CBS domain-containing protein [unclassified Streptomyces]